MGHHDHHKKAGKRPVAVHLVVVSSTRTEETDRSGPALVAALEAAGHTVAGKVILPDDPGRISARLDALLDAGARAVIFAGGTGISRKDGTFEAISGRLEKTLPGFGELLRALSYQEIGSSAMLSRATAGVLGPAVVFVIPGSPAACRLAVEKLIAPELSHLLHELDKEAPADGAAGEPGETIPAPEPVALVREAARVEAAQPRPVLPPEVGPSGWILRLWQLGGRLDRERSVPLNELVAAVPAAVNVLSRAGEQGVVSIQGADYLAFGFPDLRRPRSRVLLVGEGQPFGEILALHRWPTRTGILRNDAGGVLGASGRLGALSRDVTGRDYPESGRVLAVEGSAIYVVEGGTRVFRWDGRGRKEAGLPRGVLASLLLHWSQR